MTGTRHLVADIGATNARFGLLDAAGRLLHTRTLPCTGYPTLEAAGQAYLAAAQPDVHPAEGAIAIAGPVTGDVLTMTNHPWTFSVRDTCKALGLGRLEVVNDFTAVAMSIPLLTEADRVQVGDGSPVPGDVIGVIGPGTGLGVSGLVHGPGGWTALAGEGGHVTMAPISDRESAVLDQLRKQFNHVSAERVISGQGLVNLYEALSLLDHREPESLTPADVAGRGLDGTNPTCVEALEMFCAMLGTVAGNLALTLGSRGGVYIAGGIVPRLGGFFTRSRFRKRFVEKGRLRDYLGPIPTYVVTHELPAFLGLKAVLDKAA
ncbi:glucokinase [Skermanella mucosa]|uniref:glucokinase n=1 Tax=Skermanella mucosa TaxID=1789672 RepID=UPI00192C8903|nr:glucokinase [Skermanella mucosa]UEM19863.1 glucokinase [Skermanella mucosa]